MRNNKNKKYYSDLINVYYYPDRCIHAGMCVRGLPSVFNINEKPWINLGDANTDEVIEIVEKCPSGALQYEINGKFNEEGETPTKISTDGNKIYVRGNLLITDASDEVISTKRITLCGCGLSRNKPLCDLSCQKK